MSGKNETVQPDPNPVVKFYNESYEQEDSVSDHTKRKRRNDEDVLTEEEIERMAVEMILNDSDKRSKNRADEMGPGGWNDRGRPKTNKRFAKRIVTSTVRSNIKKK